MKKLLIWLCVLMTLCFSSALASSSYIVSNPDGGWVHLRQEPGTDSLSLGQYDNGTPVRALRDEGDGWLLVEAGDQRGFMLQSMLTRAEEEGRCEIVGSTSEGEHIVRYRAQNGQDLYFTTLEDQPKVKMEDVNFDGHSDIVVFTVLGASNHFCEFFVYEDGQYVQAGHDGIGYGVCNYTLYPEKGMVISRTNDGYAGLLHETCLFAWEGTDLKLLRRAVGQERTEMADEGGVLVQRTFLDEIHLSVRSHEDGGFEGELLWEELLRMDSGDENEALDREHTALWQGL